MAKFCKYCGSLLDETSGKCPNCDKAEITNVNDEIKDSKNNISGQEKQKKAKQKGKYLLVKIIATILALIIIVSGTIGFLVYQGVFDSDLIKNVFEYIDVNKKVSSVDRNNAETNDSDFTFYKSGDKNIVQDIESGNSYVNNELLITLDSINSKSDLELFLSDVGGKIVGEIPEIAEYQVLLDEEYTYTELLNLCSKSQKNDYIISTSLNYVMDINPSYAPNDKKWKSKWDEIPDGTNWGLEAISATGAWDKKDEMQNINIGVIDTMFDLNHEDLSFAETPLGMAIINSELSKDEREWNNHGTHTSGIISALFDNEKGIAGIMPKSNLYGVAIWGLESASRTTLQTWKIAFYYLIATNNCKVINISMGYDQLCFNASRGSEAAISATETYSNEIAEYLQILIDSDYEFVICKSAGNQNEVDGGYQYFRKDSDDTNTPYDYYSYSDYVAFLNGEKGYEHLERYKDRQDEIKDRLESGNVSADFDFLAAITNEEVRDRIIIVGAVENQGSHKEGGFLWFGRKTVHDGYKIASFSQCGEAVDVLAPGVDIYSSIQNGYENMSGTSMAAPHVSGVAGLVFAVNPNIDGKTAKEIICSSTNGQYGEEKYGLLNAQNAVDAAKNYTSPDKNEETTEEIARLFNSSLDYYYTKLYGRQYAYTEKIDMGNPIIKKDGYYLEEYTSYNSYDECMDNLRKYYSEKAILEIIKETNLTEHNGKCYINILEGIGENGYELQSIESIKQVDEFTYEINIIWHNYFTLSAETSRMYCVYERDHWVMDSINYFETNTDAKKNPPTSSYIEIMNYYNLNTYEFAEQFNMQIAEGPGGCNAFGTSEYLYRRGEWANFYSISLHSNSEQTNLNGAFQTSIISEKYSLYGVSVGMTFSECEKVLDSKGFSLDDTKTWNVDKSYYYYFYDGSDNQIQLVIYDNQCNGIDYYPNI